MGQPLTAQHLRAIMPNIPQNDEVDELPFCIEAARKNEITTKKRFAAWISNIAKESGELFYVEEIHDGSNYEGRKDLGNVRPGDGVKYKGRGYIQITGRNNYAVVGEALGIDAINNPELLEKLPNAWASAGYFWRHMSARGNLNIPADKGDFATTVLGVRGGPDPSRRKYYTRALQVLPDDLDLNAKPLEPPADPTSRPKKGLRHPGIGTYVNAHPTHFNFRADVKRLVDKYEGMDPYWGLIYINTYKDHPPGMGLDAVSFDVWHSDGRGHSLPKALGDKVFQTIFNDPTPPNIRWTIWQGRIWQPHTGWQPWVKPEDGSDPSHLRHIHVTYE